MAFSAYLPASIVLPCSFYTSSWFTHPTSSPIPGGTADGRTGDAASRVQSVGFWVPVFGFRGLECQVGSRVCSGGRIQTFEVRVHGAVEWSRVGTKVQKCRSRFVL